MPQMSPIMWPLIYLLLIHFMVIVNVTLQKTSPSIVAFKSGGLTFVPKIWMW